MSIKSLPVSWLELIWQADLPPSSKLLCAYLRSFMNDKRDMAWPSYSRVIAETGLSRATVHRHFNLLESAGWLCREPGSHGKNTKYHAAIPWEIMAAINDATPKDGFKITADYGRIESDG